MSKSSLAQFCSLGLLGLVLIVGVSPLQAQTTRFTYQGHLSESGVPATGLYDLQFRLFDALAGGNQAGTTLVRDDVQVTTGIFSVTLDFGTGVFSGADRWVEIGVRPGASSGAFTALSPLQAITSTPYSIKSLSADGLSVACVNCVGSSQIASGAVTSSLIADGTIVDADISASAAIAPSKIAGTAAILGANAFTATQTISSGNLALPNTLTGGTSGVISFGGSRFIHNLGLANTFLGANAGNFNTSGSANTASGYQALYSNTTGNSNTASGNSALYFNTTGNSNTASGDSALYFNTTGNSNTAIGDGALVFNTASGNTASGYEALYSNTTGNTNTASGYLALLANTVGNNNTASGYHALGNNTTGSGNTAVGDGADVLAGNLVNATAIGSGAVVNASNKIRLGNSSVSVIEGQVAYTYPSDKTKKENFQPVDADAVLTKLQNIDVTSWNYIGQDPKAFRHYGPMAQDFYAAFGNDGLGIIGAPTTINSGDLAGILMLAVKGLEKRTSDLKDENAELKTQVQQLLSAVHALQQRLDDSDRQ